MLKISHIQAYSDNYIWLIQTNEGNTLVDPGDASPVLDFIQREEIEIDDILITHHHFDHVGGLQSLKPLIKGSIIGPESKNIDKLDYKVKDGELITTIGLEFSVIEIPGHTLDHIAFYSNTEKEVLFCGDTIFSGGCGRVFEGTFQQMNNSINILSRLPNSTEIYCAHEYTLSNLAFAMQVEPHNGELNRYYEEVINMRKNDIATIPTTLNRELQINPFLRVSNASLRESISDKLNDSDQLSDTEIFKFLRTWKDSL
jgi:hydroxyacylglutathione hydrolase